VITWTADATGKWTETNIELMSGDNDNMVHLTTVTTLDTTAGAATTFTWTCPDVTLYAAVYFYQFSHATEPSNLIWTTRWAIESAAGEIVGAPNATQPDGSAIAWGLGELKDPSTAKPAPSYITGQTSQTGGSGVVAAAGTASMSGSVSSAATMTSAMSSMSAMVTTKAVSSKAVSSSSASSSVKAAATAASSSGAGTLHTRGSLLAVGALFAGILALV